MPLPPFPEPTGCWKKLEFEVVRFFPRRRCEIKRHHTDRADHHSNQRQNPDDKPELVDQTIRDQFNCNCDTDNAGDADQRKNIETDAGFNASGIPVVVKRCKVRPDTGYDRRYPQGRARTRDARNIYPGGGRWLPRAPVNNTVADRFGNV